MGAGTCSAVGEMGQRLRPVVYTGELAACALSLCLEIFNFARLADIGDTSAFLDTANAVRLAAGVLVAVTLVLNVAALIVRPRGRGAGVS